MVALETNGNSYIHNGGETALEDVLKHDFFGTPSFLTDAGSDDTAKYGECLTLFVQGDSSRCLEEMHKHDWLNLNTLRNNRQVSNLFLGAFETVPDSLIFSTRLRESIKQVLTGDITTIFADTSELLDPSHLLEINQYYICCAKLFRTDGSKFQTETGFLESRVRKTILDFASELQDPPNHETIADLHKLVEIYVFEIQVGLQKIKPSTSLYFRLCEDVPKLAAHFQETIDTHCGKSIENLILDQLKHKQKVNTNGTRHHNHQHHDRRTQSASDATVSPNSSGIASTAATNARAESAEEPAPSSQLTTVLGVIKRRLHFFQHIHFSHQTILIILLMLLISNKSLLKLAHFPKCITEMYKRVSPQLASLLRLLSSI